MSVTRRDALRTALLGAGSLGLRALATGLPVSLLTASEEAIAAGTCSLDMAKAQFIILSTSGSGDPMNANVPGTYGTIGGQQAAHSADPTMAETPFMLGGKATSAAKPWATLPVDVLANTSFIHHSTLNNSHTNQAKVQRLMGVITRQEMLVSYLAKQLAPCLGTVQKEPAVVGANGSGELLTYEGRTLPNLSPLGLKSTLLSPAGPLTNLQKMRDADLDRLNALIKASGNSAQKAFLDRLASSQVEARTISDTLLTRLDAIKDNGVTGQVTAAATLVAMKVAPVVSIHLPWGGDNHTDAGLLNEGKQHVSSCVAIAQLMQLLTDLGIRDKATFVAMNVFGRTLKKLGTAGRDHWGSHHATVMIGKNVKAGIVGGLEWKTNEFFAAAFNSTDGAINPSGDVPPLESLGAVGKTIGAAVGLPEATLNTDIKVGKLIKAALI